MIKYPHGIKLAAVCSAIDAYKTHKDDVPEIGILNAFEILLADSDIGKQLQALAAENAALARYFSASAGAVEHWNSWADAEDKLAPAPETPATDVYLNSLRAEGADKVADYHYVRIDFLKELSRQGHLFHKAAYSDAVNIAAQLRAGEPS
jgi:hypothetical protein